MEPPLDHPPARTLAHALRPYARRAAAQRALNSAPWALALGLPGLALGAVGWAPGWGIATAAGLAWAWRWARPWPLPRLARAADAALGLHAACDTALHLHDQGDAAAPAVLLDALDALQAAPLPPLRRPPWPPAALGLGLAAVIALWPAPPPPAPPPAPDPLAQALQTLEDEARRDGNDEVVAAVAALRATRAAAGAPRVGLPLPRATRSQAEGAAPPSAGALEGVAALAQQAAMSADPRLRAEAARVQASLEQLDALDQALRAASPANLPAAGPPATPTAGALDGEGSAGSGAEGGGGEALQPTVQAALEGGTPPPDQDPNLHPWDRAREQLLQAMAESLQEDLLNTSRDRTAGGEGATPDEGNLNIGSELGTSKAPQASALPEDPGQLSARPAGAEAATDALRTRIQRPGQAPLPGQAGAESEADGAPLPGLDPQAALAPTPGAADEVQGVLDPASLDAEQRAQALDLIARRAVSGGEAGFDEALGGWFGEAERALSEEDLPPLMEGLVRAYLAGLRAADPKESP